MHQLVHAGLGAPMSGVNEELSGGCLNCICSTLPGMTALYPPATASCALSRTWLRSCCDSSIPRK